MTQKIFLAALTRAKENKTDLMREIAAELFEIPEEQVTPEQRQYAKTVMHGFLYSA